MSKVIFRNIEKKDLDQVFVLLNQLKQIEIDTIDKDKAWSDFINNTSSNSVVGLYNNKIVAYGSVVIENKVRGEVAGHIEDIVVDLEVRGKMIGVSLIKELIKVLPKSEGPITEAHFVYPQSLKNTARVQAFRNFLFSKIGDWKS